MTTAREPADVVGFLQRVLDPDTADDLLSGLTHDVASQQASDANNRGPAGQVEMLFEHLGPAETVDHIHHAAKARLADLIGATVTGLRQVQELLRHDHLDADHQNRWNRAVSELGSLAEIETVLHGFTAFGRPGDQHLAQLWQTLTARYREVYRDRAHLLALIDGLYDMLADHGLAARTALVEQPGGEWPVLTFELPPIDDTGPQAGVQITRHIAPDDLHLFGRATALGEPAPAWDGSDTLEHHRSIRRWRAALTAARQIDAGAGCECGIADRGAPGHDGGQSLSAREGAR